MTLTVDETTVPVWKLAVTLPSPGGRAKADSTAGDLDFGHVVLVDHIAGSGVTFLVDPGDPVRAQFNGLRDQWRSESKFMSMVHDMVLLPSYQRIIGMGMSVVPYILEDLEETGDHWFWALDAITGENPIPDEDVGNVPAMADEWLALARVRGWM